MADGNSGGIEPHFWCADLARARQFYEDGLGFTVVASFPAASEPTWLQLQRDGARIMLAAEPSESAARTGQTYLGDVRARIRRGGGAVSLYLTVRDADAVLACCDRLGARIVEPIWEPFWGGRQFTVEDPDGNLWTISGPVSHD